MSSGISRVSWRAWVSISVVVGAICVSSVRAQVDHAGASTIRPTAIEAHVRYLASDLLEGREAGTRGYDLAASYVASQFQQMGLRPAGASGSYMQPVPLQATWLVKDGARLNVRSSNGRSSDLVLGRDYIVWSSPLRESSGVNVPAVFAGYGIHAPEFKHDDYAGLDVSGKVVVALFGYPASFPSEEGAHYGSVVEKEKVAVTRGAVGVVTVYTERGESVFPWERTGFLLDFMGMTWVGPDGTPFVDPPGLRAGGLMSPKAGAVLFEGAPRSYEQVRAEAANGAPEGFPLPISIEIAQRSRHERRSSANVAAVLEGSDPKLRNEYVVLVAHLDHEGIGAPVNGDRIYNGALDNAAGVASLLEAARALVSERTAPRRSVLFLAVTAEEKGLIGSDYFARHPTVPKNAMVAAVCLDMPVLLYDFTDVIAFGAQHSTLKGVLESVLRDANLTLTPDPMPAQAIFTRSDHYKFVQQGIPSILLATGWNSTKGQGDGGKVFMNFLANTYHRPSDDLNQPIDFAAGARFADVNYRLLKAIANGDARPAWNPGDFFGGIFGAMATTGP